MVGLPSGYTLHAQQAVEGHQLVSRNPPGSSVYAVMSELSSWSACSPGAEAGVGEGERVNGSKLKS